MNIRNLLQRLLPEGQVATHNDVSDGQVFVLAIDDLVIGELQYKNKVWTFGYSVLFKKQDKYSPLIEFPDVSKLYSSEVLWPFFALRIPGLTQPQVLRAMKKRKIDQSDQVALLLNFGKTSISNPFELRPRSAV